MSTTCKKVTGSLYHFAESESLGLRLTFSLDYEITLGEHGERPEPLSSFRAEDAPHECTVTGAVLTNITTDVCEELDSIVWGIGRYLGLGLVFGNWFVHRYNNDPDVKEDVDRECIENEGLRV